MALNGVIYLFEAGLTTFAMAQISLSRVE